ERPLLTPTVIRKHSLELPIGLSHRPRDGSVVSSLHCMNDPQPEGSHGKLHRTTKILSHARRRGCCVAAGGPRAGRGLDWGNGLGCAGSGGQVQSVITSWTSHTSKCLR